MKRTTANIRDLRIVDLVLEPFVCSDRLSHSLRGGQISPADAEHLAGVLPRAVAQLDAIGDPHGALALAALQPLLEPASGSLLASWN
jgi:hypothetical protein